MKIGKLAVGAWLTAWSALMIISGIMGSLGTELFSLPVFEAMVGFGMLVLAASYIRGSKE